MSERETVQDTTSRLQRVLPSARQVRLPKTAELIAGQLRRQIVTGELVEGDALPPEASLMTTFDVSRPTLREAFRVLEAEGLISVRRGAQGGARVHVPSSGVAGRYAGLVLQAQMTTLADVYAARTLLEPPAVARAAAEATSADIAHLYALCEEAERLADSDPARMIEAHDQLHRDLVGMSMSRTLTLFANIIEHILREAAQSFVSDVPATDAQRSAKRKANRTHRRVVDLVATRDTAGAEGLWHAHLNQTATLILGTPGAKTVVDLMTPYVS